MIITIITIITCFMKRRWLLQILQDNFEFWCPFKTGCSRVGPSRLFEWGSLKRYDAIRVGYYTAFTAYQQGQRDKRKNRET
jgi:hypothetical protein